MDKVDNLMAWRVFCTTFETGNLTQTSIQLNLDTGAASRLLDGLEKELGMKLLYRNRRPFIATVEGCEIYERVKTILHYHEGIVNYFKHLPKHTNQRNQRVITLSAGQAYGHGWLMPRLFEYMKLFPGVTFNTLTERSLLDLIKGDIQILLSFHRFNRQGFMTKPYAVLPCLPLATPEYIKKHGMPVKPEDLITHVGLVRSGQHFPESKNLITNGEEWKPAQWGREVQSENSIVLKQLALAGEGIVIDLPIGYFIEEFKSKLLMPVLGNWHRAPYYSAVVTTGKLYENDPEIKRFVDWIATTEGKASKERTVEALQAMGEAVEDVYSDPMEFYDPVGSFFSPNRSLTPTFINR